MIASQNHSRPIFVIFSTLLIVLLVRGLTLEYTDLIDPTESRYASIASHMLRTGNWLVPMLDLPSGVEPYLGKPPLHFWLTAISYSMFGQEEWSSRLPSFLAGLMVVLSVIRFGNKVWDKEAGLLAGVVALATPFFLLYSGGSITDVTLTACIAWGVVSAYLFFEEQGAKNRKLNASIVAVSAALGFLTKGPVAIALIGLPILIYLAIFRQLGRLKEIPWILCFCVFMVIVSPWFILSEIENPGFLKYFFWNENIARYLIKDYGDKYGSGHVYPRGMAILMMVLVTMPWALVVVYKLARDGWTKVKTDLSSNKPLLFAIIWGLSPAIFFCLVRQLHAAYLIPALPGFALSVTGLFFSKELSDSARKYLLAAVSVVGLVLIVLATYSKSYWISWPETSAFFLVGLGSLVLLSKKSASILLNCSAHLAFLSILGLFAFTPYLNSQRSAEGLLRHVLTLVKEENPQIGITATNLYSPYWLAMAGGDEFPEAMRVVYANPHEQVSAEMRHILIRKEDINVITSETRARFKTICGYGKWYWMTDRKKFYQADPKAICPFTIPAEGQ
jgi:4-amino-4-deoxy-L-arabinose transferase-like glycosyltransferase